MAKRSWKSIRAVADTDKANETEQLDEGKVAGRARRLPGLGKWSKKSEEAPVAHSHSWTNGASLTTRATGVLILAAIACGPVALVTSHSGSSRQSTPTVQTTASTADQQESAAAGQAGLEIVQAWLSATKTDHAQLDALMGSSSSTLGDQAIAYSDLQVASVAPSATASVWTVIVTATVPASTEQEGASATATVPASTEQEGASATATPTPDGPETASAAVRVAWQVPVRVVEGESGLESSAVAWPAPTTLSQVVTGGVDGYGVTLSTSSALGQTVQELLTAYITGGDVTRMISPETKLEALPVGVYTSAALTSVSAQGWNTDWTSNPPEGQVIQVMAMATLTSSSQAVSTSSWALTLKVRAGRWEVLSIDGAPASVEDGSSSSATPTPEGDK
ncbi:MAG: hypothetical protein Q4D96_10080 [Propionibacteriaceae bacterium]|nr:hypothetical protein [Propionibacteriaceae bacterium]